METFNIHIAFGSDQLPLQISNFEIQSYVLSNQQSVFAIESIQKIFNYKGKSDFWLGNMLNNISSVPDYIQNAYKCPLIVQASSDRASKNIKVIDANLFIETCKIISKSENHEKGELGKICKKAVMFYKAVKDQNITDSIAEASGYLFQKECVKNLLSDYLKENMGNPAYAWVKTLPYAFYDGLFIIHDIDWRSAREDIRIPAKIIYDIVFSRLSVDLLSQLQIQQPKRNYTRKLKQTRDNQHPKLKNYTDSISLLLETTANNLYMFLILLDRAHPVNTENRITFTFGSAPVKTKPQDSIFSPSLRMMT